MKFKTTKKAVKDGYWKCISVGYCDLQYLLQFKSPVAYTCGVYGWNADIYDFGNIAIVTGYRPFGIHIDYDIVRKYNDLAKDFISDYNIDYEERKRRADALLEDFISDALEN